MRLYVTAKGRWAGTQADAKILAREDGGWEQCDVPTDKDGLIAFLNGIRADEEEVEITGSPDITLSFDMSDPAPGFSERAKRDISVEEEIAIIDYPRAIRLAEHIHCRLMEHARAGAPAAECHSEAKP